jgi:hypothetical protein
MARVVLTILLAALLAGGAFFYWNYQVEAVYEDGRVTSVHIRAREGAVPVALPWQASNLPAARPLRPTFRIASFCVDRLDERKLANRQTSDALLRVIPQFEIVALQGFESINRGEALRLVEMLNAATGRQYDFAMGATPARANQMHYTAILFDQTAIEVDRATVHTVADPTGLFQCPPLVAQFRVRGPAAAEAFTFQLISVRTDPRRAAEELDLLDDVYRAVRDDGRNEDDIIMLGLFEADETRLGQLGEVPDLTAAIYGMPTTVRGTRRAANILFNRRATTEFSGRAEVLDLMRDADLTLEQAAEISEHLPIWAEFSSYEGGRPGVTSTAARP